MREKLRLLLETWAMIAACVAYAVLLEYLSVRFGGWTMVVGILFIPVAFLLVCE